MSLASPFLFVTGHDFRSRRKVNVHFIAEELARRGKTRVFSFGFSYLSLIKRDPRASLWRESNRVETVGGVDCYLWRTALHPFNLRRESLAGVEARWFSHYARRTPPILDAWASESSTIILESGIPLILAERLARTNPTASLIYLGSDDVRTIGCARYIADELARTAAKYRGAALASLQLLPSIPHGIPAYSVPHAIDPEVLDYAEPSPYGAGVHAVSVGSMLFDARFFEIAADLFPEVTFHLIGSGARGRKLARSNVLVHEEMSYRKTIPYVKHASFGIAPYAGERVVPYLADTSMKLMQYGYFGVPAVCPRVTVGGRPGRFGYEPGDRESIARAIRGALACSGLVPEPALTWPSVVDRLLSVA
jgi:2-beta-glucuronyltransferase